ncbi:RICIN domain-containing protein [Paenibacillus sepulcri]|uniref:RICIN domain-containing protein n=1 Tax=Paenibacillus sepulcri TaxID=359917 RepID=A0ABS7BWW5_9BACL|nr:RICIN domain-containing protein [Paenibacillus sepulcri]
MMKKRFLSFFLSLAVICSILFTSNLTTVSASDPIVSGNVYKLINPASGKALDVNGAGTANGTNVQIYTDNGSVSQKWQITSNGDGTCKLVNPNSGKALDVNGELTADGTNVQIWTSSTSVAQMWQITNNADGSLKLINPNSGKALDVNGGGTANGTNVQIWTSNTSAAQKWQLINVTGAAETIGTGSLSAPAVGPAPSFSVGGSGFVLVKNWNFGSNGTIKNISDMNSEFYYHDQFNTIGNGTNYGAITLAPDAANAISGQPIEDPNNKVRQFTTDSLKTTLVPLNGATTVSPTQHNVGNGSFQPKFTLPGGGSLLGRDILWETRVKYVTPKYFWFALWNSGNQWDGGAELDLQESFGYDNGGGNTNFDGRYWHSDPVGGTATTNYSNWGTGMASHGITSFDATQYHTYTLVYRANNTYSHYMDGIEIQSGTINWTLGATSNGTPIDFHFLVDAGWGHTGVASVNHSMPASELLGKYYEFDYSRVYLR